MCQVVLGIQIEVSQDNEDEEAPRLNEDYHDYIDTQENPIHIHDEPQPLSIAPKEDKVVNQSVDQPLEDIAPFPSI